MKKKKALITSIADALPMVVHQNNVLTLLVCVTKIEHFSIGTVDTCVIQVKDPSANLLKVQFQRDGLRVSNVIDTGFILIIKVHLKLIGKDEIVGIPLARQCVFRIINPKKPYRNTLCKLFNITITNY